MSNHNTLFNNLMHFVCSSGMRFHDLRTISTFVWALVGLIVSETIHLNLWALHRPGPAKAASKERQLSRWLHNDKIEPAVVYRPLLAWIMTEWAGETLYLALDTSQLWKRFVIVRLALVYRGRAVPLGWVVQASGSAMVAVACYQRMLAEVAELIPVTSRVVLLADRGFMDVKLMQLARQLNWRFRIRVKRSVYVYRATYGRRTVRALMPPPGQARFFSHIWLTEQRFGPLHLALAYIQTQEGYQQWAIVSDEPVSLKTFDEYGLRFDIEENFLDDKS
ncbi:MAG TPA: transposase, partial [Anaerolineae bacterium]|nr:transposase [Anaerolineae bacterium]